MEAAAPKLHGGSFKENRAVVLRGGDARRTEQSMSLRPMVGGWCGETYHSILSESGITLGLEQTNETWNLHQAERGATEAFGVHFLPIDLSFPWAAAYVTFHDAAMFSSARPSSGRPNVGLREGHGRPHWWRTLNRVFHHEVGKERHPGNLKI